jgi:chloramphenicol 3-O-phosphotransferase
MPRLVVVTGQQAAGKSTVGRLLATRLTPPAIWLDGDVFYEMVQAGRASMSPDPSPEALRQLRMRYESAAMVVQKYLDAGFDAVYTDIITGADLETWMTAVTGAERHLVVLRPSAEAIVERELARAAGATYEGWMADGQELVDAVRATESWFADTPRRGLWLDTTGQTPEQSVAKILADDLAAARY